MPGWKHHADDFAPRLRRLRDVLKTSLFHCNVWRDLVTLIMCRHIFSNTCNMHNSYFDWKAISVGSFRSKNLTNTFIKRLQNVLNDCILHSWYIHQTNKADAFFFILLWPRNDNKTSYTISISTSPLSVHMVFVPTRFYDVLQTSVLMKNVSSTCHRRLPNQYS